MVSYGPSLLSSLLLACTLPPADDSADAVPTPAETGSVPCPTVDAIQVSGDASPGMTLTLLATGAGSDTTTWTVEVGTLSAVTGASVDWTLPEDLAVDEAESVTATATTACQAQAVTLTVDVNRPEADRVVVLYNPAVEGSEDVARAYMAFRSVPDGNLCAIAASDSTNMAGAEFETWGRDVLDCVQSVGPHVFYILPVYGVPYRVSDRIDDLAYGSVKATVSIDALLAWGEDGLAATDVDYHPLYRNGSSSSQNYGTYREFGNWRANHPEWAGLYLVTRIDGASAAAAIDLIDRTARAEATVLTGTVYVDGNRGSTPPTSDTFGSYESGEWNMWGTKDVFEAFGAYPVVADFDYAEFGTAPAPEWCPDALYYAGWYSYYHYNDAFEWTVGAIGGHLDSCSACDLRSGTWSAEALKRGITATFGAVSEPYVAGMPEYDQFFYYLVEGASYGEAAYESTVVGRWMMVWVGDPLYRPYRKVE